MYCKVNKCCFCCSLRWGIILFAYINVMLSAFAVACLVITTELHKDTIIAHDSLENVTATVLFAILGMGVLLNVLLLVAGYQKDITMLKLYNYYAVATTIAALIPTFILLSRMYVTEVCAASFAIVMQCYVIVLVRSEILMLKQKQMRRNQVATNEHLIVVPDTTVLI
ncbi:hypothetical protein O0L34_g3923 [Tuta absoluta]|nr:hypothetical protein O0L34_g3923 [Tuta absoluta]